jgi:hypothetical protein
MQTLVCAILMYVTIMALVTSLKLPPSMYDPKAKRYRAFGTSPDATLFPMWLCASVVAIMSYLSASVLLSWLQFASPMHPMTTAIDASFAATGDPVNNHSTASALSAPIPPSPMRRAAFGGDMSFAPQQSSQQPQHQSQHSHAQPYANPQLHNFYPHAASYTRSHPNHLPHHTNVRKSVHDSRIWKKAMT